MAWLDRCIKWVMLISGLLTFTMVYAALAPAAALRATFGESLEGPVANIVVRTWGALIALVGAMLVYGAFRPAVQPMVLAVAGTSKLVFIALVLSTGREFLGPHLAVSVVADSLMVLLFVAFLVPRAAPRSTA